MSGRIDPNWQAVRDITAEVRKIAAPRELATRLDATVAAAVADAVPTSVADAIAEAIADIEPTPVNDPVLPPGTPTTETMLLRLISLIATKSADKLAAAVDDDSVISAWVSGHTESIVDTA